MEFYRINERRSFSRPGTGQLITCDTGWCIQKSHIMMIHTDLLLDPVQEILHLDLCRL